MSSLIELVNECAPAETDGKAEAIGEQKAALLKEVGLSRISRKIEHKSRAAKMQKVLAQYGYIEIKMPKIIAFLKTKAVRYNTENRNLTGIKLFDWSAHLNDLAAEETLANAHHDNTAIDIEALRHGSKYGECVISFPTCHWLSTGDDAIGCFQWREQRIEDYDKLPPDHVVEKLKFHKGRTVFDYFTVATVNSIKDPLLLGRLVCSKSRYYIAQWDDDVSLDEVV